jgi:hypothetical protein
MGVEGVGEGSRACVWAAAIKIYRTLRSYSGNLIQEREIPVLSPAFILLCISSLHIPFRRPTELTLAIFFSTSLTTNLFKEMNLAQPFFLSNVFLLVITKLLKLTVNWICSFSVLTRQCLFYYASHLTSTLTIYLFIQL